MGIEAEEIQEENIDLAALANAEEPEEVIEEELQLSDTEQKAYDQGWRPQADFEGPEDNWKTAREYVRDGEFLATIKELNQRMDQQGRDFDTRLENSNKLHEARKDKEIKDLKAQQRDAVRASDTDAFDDAQNQIEELEKEVETETKKAVDPVIAAWELKNPWINDPNDEKMGVAQSVWNQYITKNPTASNAQALAHVDERIGKLYPASDNSNPRRNQQNTNETPAKRGKKGSKSLTMGDLTQDEKNDWTQFGSMFKDEAAFLKAAKDARVK